MSATATAAPPTVIPQNVVVPNPNTVTPVGKEKIPNPPKKVFALQVQAWGDLQQFIYDALNVPILKEGFTARYGEFKDKAIVDQALPTINQLSNASKKYGNVISEAGQIAKFAGQDTPPPSLFAHAIWLASKIESKAAFVQSMAKVAIPAIEKETDMQKRANDIKELLTNRKGGMWFYADALRTECQNYNKKLSAYFKDDLTPAIKGFKEYVDGSDNVLNSAKSALGKDDQLIKNLPDAIDTTRSEYYGWAAGGGIATVVLLVTPFGLPGAIAMGTTSGIEAEKLRKRLNELEKELEDAKDDKRKKTLLVTDYTLLKNKLESTLAAAKTFSSAVTTMSKGFGSCADHLDTIANAVTPDAVKDLPTFLQNTQLGAAEDQWGEIKTATNRFLISGQFTYKTSS